MKIGYGMGIWQMSKNGGELHDQTSESRERMA